MSTKTKGINAERELIHMFWGKGWSAVRIAGSGSSKYPSADILASNIARKITIEAKLTKNPKKYFNKQEIDQFKLFSSKFGAEPWIAVKFKKIEWFFVSLEDLEKTANGFVISIKLARNKGLTFNQLINKF